MTIKAKQIERSGNGISSTTAVAASPYTILQSDVNLLINSSAARTLLLPVPSTRWSGFVWDIGGLALVNNITLQRNAAEKINGVAQNLALTLNGGRYSVITDGVDWYVGGSQLTPDYSGEITVGAIATTPILTIALNDNNTYRIYLYITAVDQTGNKAEWISIVTWYRINAGAPFFLGTDKGPAPVNNISTSVLAGNWVTITNPSANNLVFNVVTLAATPHIKFTWQVYVQPIPQTLAA